MRKLLGLQYLRGLAAVAVVLFHAAGRAGANFHAGEAGVDLFFLLSGFLMVAISGPKTRPLPFLADRARRIIPVYWIATSVMLAASMAGLFPKVRLETGHVLASYLFIPWTSPSNGNVWPLLVPGWTLNFEMAFYLLFAALLPLGGQVRQIAALTAVLAGVVMLGPIVDPANAMASFYTDPILLEFAGGCWLGILWKRPGEWPRWLGWGTAGFALAMIGWAAFSAATIHRAIGFGIPAALLLASILAIERRNPIGEWRLPLLLGDASYSIYIWHTLAISVTMRLSSRLDLPTAASVTLGITGGIAAGLVGYWLIERPILRWFRERRYVRGVPVPAGP
ncbi:MAG: acyltransferase [Pseudomonadota bacterium]